MPPTQLPLALAQRHNNQQLFSDHYLNVTLPQRADWQLLAHDAGRVFTVIAPIVQAFLRAPAQNEAQTEDDLIKPTLRVVRDGYAEPATSVQRHQAEVRRLERRPADLVNQAYGLTPEEVDLLWRTAPRMPGVR